MADTQTSPRASAAASKRAAGTAKTDAAKAPRRGRSAAASASSRSATRPKAATAKRGATRTTAASSNGAATRKRITATRGPAGFVGDYAERAVLIPVGAALIARDRVVSSVNDVVSNYASPSKAQTQLRRFERRGNTARNRLEREVRKTRTRVERELRQRRRELDRQRGRVAKSLTSQVEQTQAQIERTQAQIEGAVRARLEDGADFATRVQERVLNLV